MRLDFAELISRFICKIIDLQRSHEIGPQFVWAHERNRPLCEILRREIGPLFVWAL